MEFTLFKKEKTIIEQAKQVVASPEYSPDKLREYLHALINALEQSYREQKRLIRVSDRQQEQLRAIKKELQVKAKQLEHLANTDDLTGLNNRCRFLELLQKEIKRAERTGRALSLMMIDIDHFKRINDRFGHMAGDRVLSHFANLLLVHTREIDEAGRLGGEEFGITLPETTAKEALAIANRLKNKVENQRFVISSETIKITISIGIAALKETETREQLLGRADAAMYTAKQKGRNRAEIAGGIPAGGNP